jgi:hypothetical protein
MDDSNFFKIDKILLDKLLDERPGPFARETVIKMLEMLDGSWISKDGESVYQPVDDWE